MGNHAKLRHRQCNLI